MSSKAQQNLSRRHAREKRFKFMGLFAVLLACSFLVVLLGNVFSRGIPAFTHHYLNLPINFAGSVDINAPEKGNYKSAYQNGVRQLLPFIKGRKQKRAANSLVSRDVSIDLQNRVLANPTLITSMSNAWVPFDDSADLYLKGLIAENSVVTINGPFALTQDGKKITITNEASTNGAFDEVLRRYKSLLIPERDKFDKLIGYKNSEIQSLSASNVPQIRIDKARDALKILETQRNALVTRLSNGEIPETLNRKSPSLLVSANGATIKITSISTQELKGKFLIVPEKDVAEAVAELELRTVFAPERNRKFSDLQIAMVEHLRGQDAIDKRFNSLFFTKGASRQAEQAGIFGAVIGSLLTMSITLLVAFPLGILTAIYLEEFAPKNRITAIIEVNINNLAAVPSIIFGLLGLAIFLNWFEFPRSAPLVGGLVLALMTLPSIIIASRAALKAVPPSIRDAAMGIGASKVQTVFHHVLPLAMPGMLTGTIIGMAQALGETAPLLMIGMVAFVVDLPSGLSDPATVLPVQIYMWADFPEPAFRQKTAAAILVLLAFLLVMNALAVLLRRRFERRW